MQFVAITQRGDDADNGIEADDNEFNNNALPRSNPQIYNITLCGDPDRNEGGESPARRQPPPRHGVHDSQLPGHRLQDRRVPDRDDQHGHDRAGGQRHLADGRGRRVGHADEHARERDDLHQQWPVPEHP